MVYCRVLSAEKFDKVQLSCINPLDKKAWNSGQAFFHDLKGGFVKDLPIAYCRQRLLAPKSNDYLLQQLSETLAFEICIGFNGKVWIKAERAVDTVLVMNALQTIVDLGAENGWDWLDSEECRGEVD